MVQAPPHRMHLTDDGDTDQGEWGLPRHWPRVVPVNGSIWGDQLTDQLENRIPRHNPHL